uniref:Uncharacterized protein n=1 Tax=viral metagenome TaxID=1070528 RepID=A0A6C0B9C2_9ZZZZ
MFKKLLKRDNYTILYSYHKVDLSKKIMKRIDNENHLFISSTPTIIELPNHEFLVNLRWINYKLNSKGFLFGINDVVNNNVKNLNSRFKVNTSFQPISNEIFLNEDLTYKPYMVGLEDIRIFYYNNSYYYNATIMDTKRNVHATTSQVYPIDNTTYELSRPIIEPTHYDIQKNIISEKNWSFVNYNNELCIVYLWFPLQLGKIDYVTNQLKMIKSKQMPEYFKYVRGSTPGYTKNNEIWFVVHKSNKKEYLHFFVIFDLQMKLLRYSELFKFENVKVEFCISLIVQDNQLILSYSLMDEQSFIATYTMNYIKKLKWY